MSFWNFPKWNEWYLFISLSNLRESQFPIPKKFLMQRFNSCVINVRLLDQGKNCKRLLQRHLIFYEETFSSEIKNIDSSFSTLLYSFHSAYQEREIVTSMKREKALITSGLIALQNCDLSNEL